MRNTHAKHLIKTHFPRRQIALIINLKANHALTSIYQNNQRQQSKLKNQLQKLPAK